MHIVTPFFITCSDPTCMRDRERGIVCIRWSNLVVVVDCDTIHDLLWCLPIPWLPH
jgi:hypothetical protein